MDVMRRLKMNDSQLLIIGFSMCAIICFGIGYIFGLLERRKSDNNEMSDS